MRIENPFCKNTMLKTVVIILSTQSFRKIRFTYYSEFEIYFTTDVNRG